MGGELEGFYGVYYTGVSGFGHAILVLQSGKITGADATGGLYDGTYESQEQGRLNIQLALVVPAGSTLVTGQTLNEALTQHISAELPSGFANGAPVAIQTQMGPVNANFKKLRELT